MWRIGFAFWAGWQVLKWGLVGALVLFLLYLWGGFNGALVLAGLGVAGGLLILRKTLGNLYRREVAERR